VYATLSQDEQGCPDGYGPRSVRPSLVTETAVRSSAFIIAGI